MTIAEQNRIGSRRFRAKHPKYNALIQKQFKSEHPSFVNWIRMVDRCMNPKCNRYEFYGAKGISVHRIWLTFPRFEQDFGYSKPGPGYTIDRIDNDGDYESGNVQWLTKSENSKKRWRL